MSDKPNKQHTVPRFLLTRFTIEQADTALLWVTDLQERRQWRSSPNKAARQTNFYTGEFGPGVDSYHVEKSLSICETKCAPVINKILETSSLPDKQTDDFAEMMSFIAFQASRGSSTRAYIAEFFDESSRQECIESLADEANWNRFVRHRASLGESVELSREEMLVYAERGEYQISVDKTWMIQQQVRAAVALMFCLSVREWSLFMAEDGAPDFVCSDSPVCVATDTGATDRSVGYCQPGSVVTLPIGRRHALAGFFEGSKNMSLPPKEVAGVNTMTMQHAQQIYSATADFKYLQRDGRVGSANDLLTARHA